MAGFRIGPARSPVTVLGRRGSRIATLPAPDGGQQGRLSTNPCGLPQNVDKFAGYTRGRWRPNLSGPVRSRDSGGDAEQRLATALRPPERGRAGKDPRFLPGRNGATNPTPSRISWNAAGAVVESFSPDFYLPEVDLYLELTTLKQSLVRRKNRKLRWLRQLYPEIRVKLFYARDFQALMVKYGRLDFLADVTAMNGNGPLNDAYRRRGLSQTDGNERHRHCAAPWMTTSRRSSSPTSRSRHGSRSWAPSWRPTTPSASRCWSAC